MILRNIYKKFKSTKGETLTETLGSLLIIVPGMVMLAGAIVTAAKINNEAKDIKASKFPSYLYSEVAGEGSLGDASAGGDTSGLSFTTGSIKWYTEKNIEGSNSEYYYFK